MHGSGASSRYFYFMGWVAGLKDHYRLILIDARGHGSSDKPHKPEAYRMRLMAGDVTAVLDDLGIDKAHYFGYSMGGAIGWGLAKYYSKRVTSLIIGGFWAEDPGPSIAKDPEELKYLRTLRKGNDALTKAFLEGLKKEKKTIQKPAVINRLRPYRLRAVAGADPKAMLALEVASLRGREHMLGLLPDLTIPCLLFVGKKDIFFKGAKKASALLQHGRFVSFPGLGHIETWARLDLALPPVLKFLNDVDRGVIVR